MKSKHSEIIWSWNYTVYTLNCAKIPEYQSGLYTFDYSNEYGNKIIE